MTTTPDGGLLRKLGPAAVIAVVAGDMLGSGVFFTPGELAAVASARWQVYFLWGLCGLISLCGALTLAELSVLLPRAGASFHIIQEGFGPFWGFVKIWIELWVSGPGSVAGVAILFGEFASRGLGLALPPGAFGAAAILAFTAINLAGIEWGARTQIALTVLKVGGLAALVVGAIFFATPAAAESGPQTLEGGGVYGFLRLVGLGVAVVLYTYDGWVDVSHVAGEVREPKRNLPLGLGLGVAGITLLYLLINFAFLRVVPLQAMRAEPTMVAARVAHAAFGPQAGSALNVAIMVSILGAMGGLVMTQPRLYYAAAARYEEAGSGARSTPFFRALSLVSRRSAVPYGSTLFLAALALAALFFFGSFRHIATFFVVPLHFVNILMVASIFKLRPRMPTGEGSYRTPGYPVVPLVYIFVLSLFLASALVFEPRDTLVGVGLTATAVPAYWWIHRRR